jgi:hypothetical protein
MIDWLICSDTGNMYNQDYKAICENDCMYTSGLLKYKKEKFLSSYGMKQRADHYSSVPYNIKL